MSTLTYLSCLAAVQALMYLHAQGVFSGSLDHYGLLSRISFVNAGIFLGIVYIFYNACNIITTIIKFSVHPQDEKSMNDVLLLGFSFVQIFATGFFIGFLNTGVVRFLHAALLSIPLMVFILFSLNLPSIFIKNYSNKGKVAVIFSFLFILGLSFSPYLFLKYSVNPSLGIAFAIVTSLLIATFFGCYLFVVDYDKAFIPHVGEAQDVVADPAGNRYVGRHNVGAAPAGDGFGWAGGLHDAPAGISYGWPGGHRFKRTILSKLEAAKGSEENCNVCWDIKPDVIVLADFAQFNQASTSNVACKECWSKRIEATPNFSDILDLDNVNITEGHDFYPASIMRDPSQ